MSDEQANDLMLRVLRLEQIVTHLTKKLNNAEANFANGTQTHALKVAIDHSGVDAAIAKIEQALAQIRSRKHGK